VSITSAGQESSGRISRAELAACLDTLLEPGRFKDYCPNGLQVEGEAMVTRLLCGVTASLALVKAAAASGAQAVLVHHGYFWRGEDPRLVGTRRERVATLLAHGINLFAYHLPLDLHPEFGNNVQLARRLGWPVTGRAGDDGLVCLGDLDGPRDAGWLRACLAGGLDREPLLVGDTSRSIRRLAWCTGAAQDHLQVAIDAGADAFVSGEISERTTHLAREAGVVYASAGHHATERYGVQALGKYLAGRFGLQVDLLDDPNPV
jgi:dinuclear metal center YbgI/SA1388 family protein